jgi:hypothetical protein
MRNAIKTTLLVIVLLLAFHLEPFHFVMEPAFMGLALGVMNYKVSRLKPIWCILLTIGFSFLALYTGMLLLYVLDLFSGILPHLTFDPKVFFVCSGLLAAVAYYLLLSKIYYNLNIYKGVKTLAISYVLVPIVVLGGPMISSMVKEWDFLIFFSITWLLVVSFFTALALNNYYIFEGDTYKKALSKL